MVVLSWAVARRSAAGPSAGSMEKPMTATVDVQTLREATEDDVEAALFASYVQADLAGIEPDVLLEFWNRMIDQFAGVPGD